MQIFSQLSPAFVTVKASPLAPASFNDAAIAAAIASLPANGPGVLVFPYAGNSIYLISQSIIIDRDNVALIAFGQRGTVTIQIDPSADPTWALIVGNTKNVNNCLIDGLSFLGRNSGSSTGGGILFRSSQGKIRQTQVQQFGKKGLSVIAFSGTLFEVYMEDIDLVQNGMNTGAHDDNLVIDSTVSDCEYHRVISAGNSTKNTTRNGINNSGNQQKFVDCHCYWSSNDGFLNAGAGMQIMGGEYENNVVNGIESQSQPGLNVSGVAAFGNGNVDIAAFGQATISRNVLSSTAFQNIYVNSASGGVIADNIISGATTNAILLDTGAANYSVHDNQCAQALAATIATSSTNSDIHDNTLTAGGISELVGANNNLIHDNQIAAGKTITIVGSGTKVRNNPGYNPQGAAAIVVTASPFTYTAGPTPETVYISGGTVSVVAKNAITLFAATNCNVNLEPHEAVTVTYSVAPTMNKDRH